MVRLSYAIADEGMTNEFRCDLHESDSNNPKPCYTLRDVNRIGLVRPSAGRFERSGLTRPLTADQVWVLLLGMGKWDTSTNVFANCLFLDVCPNGLIAYDMDKYIEMEAVCSSYHTPPVDGGIDNWPALTYDAFLAIRKTHEQIKGEKSLALREKKRQRIKLG